MSTGRELASSELAGRETELALIRDALSAAVDGRAVTLLVTGDAGVGKTALVRVACQEMDSSLVLFGTCLPLTNMAMPFLGIRSAVRGRKDVEGSERLFNAPEGPEHIPVVIDAWLDDLCSSRLVVLAIDDLQWADRSTLDSLMYIVAGPRSRSLAVIATIRSSELDEGHGVHQWLSDINRMPGTAELKLSALDRLSTGAQVSALLGSPAHESLVDDVFARTQGNAYLNQLIVAGVAPDARHLDPELKPDLRAAVLRSWTRLPPPARRITQVIAAAGGPVTLSRLGHVMGKEVDGRGLLDVLRDVVDAGSLETQDGERFWFRHPLMAEALIQNLLAHERRELHARFADELEREASNGGSVSLEDVVQIADHNFLAERPEAALAWALRAAESASETGGHSEAVRLFARAVQIGESHFSDVVARRHLLRYWMEAAQAAGDDYDELRASELLIDAMDPLVEPLDMAELLTRRVNLLSATGSGFNSVEEAKRATELASADQASWQYAHALANLAWAEYWHGDSKAAAVHTDQAWEIAETLGNDKSLASALAARSAGAFFDEQGELTVEFATRSADAAVRAGDHLGFARAALLEANGTEMWTTRTYAQVVRRRRMQATSLGLPHSYLAYLAADEASAWIAAGDWQSGVECLRIALGANPGPSADVHARLAAARLAALQGRAGEARGHLDRAKEIFPPASAYLSFEFDAVEATVALAEDRPDAAFTAAMAGLHGKELPPTMCEWLLPLAARALADQADRLRDGGLEPHELIAQAVALQEGFPEIIRDIGATTPALDRQIDALDKLYRAEIARATRDVAAAELWQQSVVTANEAELPWEEAYASFRHAEALLMEHRAGRAAAADALRAGMRLATSLQAKQLIEEMTGLAAAARITLETPPEIQPRISSARLNNLTPRERVILAHLVVGRTYGEISRELFISEKTVSSHVSNLLRKTGARNRVELARLAAGD